MSNQDTTKTSGDSNSKKPPSAPPSQIDPLLRDLIKKGKTTKKAK